MSVHEVIPVRLSTAVRRVWQQFSRPVWRMLIVDCALCGQSNKRTLLLFFFYPRYLCSRGSLKIGNTKLLLVLLFDRCPYNSFALRCDCAICLRR